MSTETNDLQARGVDIEEGNFSFSEGGVDGEPLLTLVDNTPGSYHHTAIWARGGKVAWFGATREDLTPEQALRIAEGIARVANNAASQALNEEAE